MNVRVGDIVSFTTEEGKNIISRVILFDGDHFLTVVDTINSDEGAGWIRDDVETRGLGVSNKYCWWVHDDFRNVENFRILKRNFASEIMETE